MRLTMDFRGIREVKRKYGRATARRLRERIEDDIEQGIDDMAEMSFTLAPEETGALMHSILASVQKDGWAEYIYGSHLPYAQRQEYEHAVSKGYFRKSVRYHKPIIKEKIEFTISDTIG